MKHKKNGNWYNDVFRKMIVELYHSGQSVQDLSSGYGVSDVTIYKWIKNFTPTDASDKCVQKHEFQLESICVRSLKRLNMLFQFLSMMITFMSLKIEKKNDFFHRVIERARGTKATEEIRMFLYRFSAGMKAILEKDPNGNKHFKYLEKPKNPRQLEFTLWIQ